MTPRPRADVPDHRGPTGLDQTEQELDYNPDVVVRDVELPPQGRYVLRRTVFDHRRRGAEDRSVRPTSRAFP
ncbi:hypothetical protein GCM10018784_69250 [Streptomyces hydrogenans]|nr:hypothetical protein GCM10018784_69250 [Streptomyces hydrogenans]